MISKFQLVAVTLAGVFACGLAGAQGRNGSSPAGRTPEHAATPSRAPAAQTGTAAATPANRQSRVIQIPANGRMASGFAEDANSGNFDTSGSPGLGFDFPHLAAIGGSRRGSVHSGRRNHFQQGVQQGTFVPVFFGGYPYYADDFVSDQSEQQPFAQQYAPQPQIIVIQQPAPEQQQLASPDAAFSSGRIDSAVPVPEPAPVRDIGNFILVRRDGRILFASAFSVVGPQVHYVTPDGIRRTLAVSDIDSEATREMNEERGTTVQIHN